MNLKDITTYLTNFSTKNNLIEHAKETCMIAINNCINDSGPEEIGNRSVKELILEVDKQSLVFKDWSQDIPYIKTRIGIYVNDPDVIWARNLKPIGYYELNTDGEGNHFDDWLIFDEK